MEKEEGEGQHKGKWAGKLAAKLTGPKAEQIWPFFQDYCNFHKWHPTLDVCRRVEGVEGQPGCVRYCAGGEVAVSWVKEKLLAIDPIERTLSYEIVDNNAGFGSYVATFAVLPEPDGDGCTIEWSFVADPVEGLTQAGLVSYLDSLLQAMAKKMGEDARELGQRQSQ